MNQQLKAAVDRLFPHQPELSPKRVWDPALDDAIASLDATAGGTSDPAYALALKAGLHLWNESLDRSHRLSQDVHNATGSYWHGIMHRMEPDYDNAAYWFRRVGRHPVFEALRERAARLLRESDRFAAVNHAGLKRELAELADAREWDLFRFIRLAELQETEGRDPAAAALLKEIQRIEIVLLLAHTYRQACGGMLFEVV